MLGQDDCRVPSNLVDGVVNSTDGSHAWLAPFAVSLPPPNPANEGGQPMENVVYVLFNHPVTITCIRLWNYRKTPSRGTREITLSLDGNMLYRGGVRKAPDEGSSEIYQGQSVLFTNDPAVVRKEKEAVLYCGTEEQDVLCIDEVWKS